MRISDWSSDVCSSDLTKTGEARIFKFADAPDRLRALKREAALSRLVFAALGKAAPLPMLHEWNFDAPPFFLEYAWGGRDLLAWAEEAGRSEEHTSELQSLMRISYAVFCLKKKNKRTNTNPKQ